VAGPVLGVVENEFDQKTLEPNKPYRTLTNPIGAYSSYQNVNRLSRKSLADAGELVMPALFS
jgi:hypothetical protein